MLENIIKSMKRGNALSLLFQTIMQTKVQKEAEAFARRNAIHFGGFSSQHHSKARQQKLAYMRQFGIKTGKAYRRHMKAQNRILREEALNNA
jgi:hypothetical protein